MSLTGILLAAGGAQRFGRDKRRLLLPDGQDLLSYSARRLRRVLDDVLVVLRPEDDDIAPALLAIGCRVCRNPLPERGMGSSVNCGVQASQHSDGWLVQPVDLPLLREATIRRVAERLRSAAAVVPLCHGRHGHPVGFARQFRDRLLALDGVRGARPILQRAAPDVVWLNVHDPGIYRDIDRPDDLARLAAHWGSLEVPGEPPIESRRGTLGPDGVRRQR